jgi:Ca2+-binding RTX toxin-like protein
LIRNVAAACGVFLASFAIALAAPAGAAVVSYDSAGLHVMGDDQVDNLRVGLAASGATFTVERALGGAFSFGGNTPLTAGAGCVQTSAAQVDCPSVTVPRADIRLAGGDDQLTHTPSDAFDSTIFLGDGDDEITSGVGVFTPPAGSDVVHGEAGNDRIDTAGGSDVIEAGPGDDRLVGAGGSDTLRGGAGSDVLSGDSTALVGGVNQVEGPLVADTVDGGPGTDTVDFAEFSSRTRISLEAGEGGRLVPGSTTVTEGDSYASIENLIGSRGGNDIVGTNGPNVIEGGNGDDTIVALGGEDTLVGGVGRDTLDGGAGADKLNARDEVPDVVSCGTERGVKGGPFATNKLSAVDSLDADPRDRIANDCETVDITTNGDDPTVAIRGSSFTVGTGGSVTFALSCPRETDDGCSGRLAARLSRSVKIPARAGSSGTRYSIRPGRSRHVKVKLPASDRNLLARRPGVSAALLLTSREGVRNVVRLVRVRYRR